MPVFKIPVKEFKRSNDPLERENKRRYTCYVHVDNVPKNIPMLTNPREQKLTSSVAQKIEKSLLSNDGNFHIKNRGIVISADKVIYDNKTNTMTMVVTEPYEHGDIDGGHTYKLILEHQNEGVNQYVSFEVMVGVEDIIEDLAEARNTSAQVDEKSMAELGKHFEPIKDGIGGMPFFNRIAFKQNQQLVVNGKNVKMIDAREIVAILTMFHAKRYGAENHPLHAYSSKARVLKDYLQVPSDFEKFTNIATDIFDLYDLIELDFAEAYNKTGGRYGAKKYSGYKTDKNDEPLIVGKSKFSLTPMQYKVPDGLIYPLMGAFRSLIDYDKKTDKYFWIKQPEVVYNEIRESIVSKVVKFTESIGNNPNATGKDSNVWDILYMTVKLKAI
ncbi:abortive phage infection protein [Bacillus anthracis]|nr:abortive phage infection protein [Bacillus anthracis]PGT39821.1 abortive phage infection protein [Bacillus anthracis]